MSQNKPVEEVVDIAIANLIFSGLSIAQMEKIPKWLLENIEKNKSDFKSTINQTSQEIMLNALLDFTKNVRVSDYEWDKGESYINKIKTTLTNHNKD